MAKNYSNEGYASKEILAIKRLMLHSIASFLDCSIFCRAHLCRGLNGGAGVCSLYVKYCILVRKPFPPALWKIMFPSCHAAIFTFHILYLFVYCLSLLYLIDPFNFNFACYVSLFICYFTAFILPPLYPVGGGGLFKYMHQEIPRKIYYIPVLRTTSMAPCPFHSHSHSHLSSGVVR